MCIRDSLNATIRGAAKALYQRFGDDVEIVGILNGYDGLIKGEWREMQPVSYTHLDVYKRQALDDDVRLNAARRLLIPCAR